MKGALQTREGAGNHGNPQSGNHDYPQTATSEPGDARKRTKQRQGVWKTWGAVSSRLPPVPPGSARLPDVTADHPEVHPLQGVKTQRRASFSSSNGTNVTVASSLRKLKYLSFGDTGVTSLMPRMCTSQQDSNLVDTENVSRKSEFHGDHLNVNNDNDTMPIYDLEENADSMTETGEIEHVISNNVFGKKVSLTKKFLDLKNTKDVKSPRDSPKHKNPDRKSGDSSAVDAEPEVRFVPKQISNIANINTNKIGSGENISTVFQPKPKALRRGREYSPLLIEPVSKSASSFEFALDLYVSAGTESTCGTGTVSEDKKNQFISSASQLTTDTEADSFENSKSCKTRTEPEQMNQSARVGANLRDINNYRQLKNRCKASPLKQAPKLVEKKDELACAIKSTIGVDPGKVLVIYKSELENVCASEDSTCQTLTEDSSTLQPMKNEMLAVHSSTELDSQQTTCSSSIQDVYASTECDTKIPEIETEVELVTTSKTKICKSRDTLIISHSSSTAVSNSLSSDRIQETLPHDSQSQHISQPNAELSCVSKDDQCSKTPSDEGDQTQQSQGTNIFTRTLVRVTDTDSQTNSDIFTGHKENKMNFLSYLVSSVDHTEEHVRSVSDFFSTDSDCEPDDQSRHSFKTTRSSDKSERSKQKTCRAKGALSSKIKKAIHPELETEVDREMKGVLNIEKLIPQFKISQKQMQQLALLETTQKLFSSDSLSDSLTSTQVTDSSQTENNYPTNQADVDLHNRGNELIDIFANPDNRTESSLTDDSLDTHRSKSSHKTSSLDDSSSVEDTPRPNFRPQTRLRGSSLKKLASSLLEETDHRENRDCKHSKTGLDHSESDDEDDASTSVHLHQKQSKAKGKRKHGKTKSEKIGKEIAKEESSGYVKNEEFKKSAQRRSTSPDESRNTSRKSASLLPDLSSSKHSEKSHGKKRTKAGKELEKTAKSKSTKDRAEQTMGKDQEPSEQSYDTTGLNKALVNVHNRSKATSFPEHSSEYQHTTTSNQPSQYTTTSNQPSQYTTTSNQPSQYTTTPNQPSQYTTTPNQPSLYTSGQASFPSEYMQYGNAATQQYYNPVHYVAVDQSALSHTERLQDTQYGHMNTVQQGRMDNVQQDSMYSIQQGQANTVGEGSNGRVVVGQYGLNNGQQGQVNLIDRFQQNRRMDTQQQGPASWMGAVQMAPVNGMNAVQQGPASRMGAGQQAPASWMGAVQQGPVNGMGAGQQGPASWMGAAQMAPINGMNAVQQGPAIWMGAVPQGPLNGMGAVQLGPVNGMGTGQQGPDSRMGAGQQGPDSRMGIASDGQKNLATFGQLGQVNRVQTVIDGQRTSFDIGQNGQVTRMDAINHDQTNRFSAASNGQYSRAATGQDGQAGRAAGGQRDPPGQQGQGGYNVEQKTSRQGSADHGDDDIANAVGVDYPSQTQTKGGDMTPGNEVCSREMSSKKKVGPFVCNPKSSSACPDSQQMGLSKGAKQMSVRFASNIGNYQFHNSLRYSSILKQKYPNMVYPQQTDTSLGISLPRRTNACSIPSNVKFQAEINCQRLHDKADCTINNSDIHHPKTTSLDDSRAADCRPSSRDFAASNRRSLEGCGTNPTKPRRQKSGSSRESYDSQRPVSGVLFNPLYHASPCRAGEVYGPDIRASHLPRGHVSHLAPKKVRPRSGSNRERIVSLGSRQARDIYNMRRNGRETARRLNMLDKPNPSLAHASKYQPNPLNEYEYRFLRSHSGGARRRTSARVRQKECRVAETRRPGSGISRDRVTSLNSQPRKDSKPTAYVRKTSTSCGRSSINRPITRSYGTRPISRDKNMSFNRPVSSSDSSGNSPTNSPRYSKTSLSQNKQPIKNTKTICSEILRQVRTSSLYTNFNEYDVKCLLKLIQQQGCKNSSFVPSKNNRSSCTPANVSQKSNTDTKEIRAQERMIECIKLVLNKQSQAIDAINKAIGDEKYNDVKLTSSPVTEKTKNVCPTPKSPSQSESFPDESTHYCSSEKFTDAKPELDRLLLCSVSQLDSKQTISSHPDLERKTSSRDNNSFSHLLLEPRPPSKPPCKKQTNLLTFYRAPSRHSPQAGCEAEECKQTGARELLEAHPAKEGTEACARQHHEIQHSAIKAYSRGGRELNGTYSVTEVKSGAARQPHTTEHPATEAKKYCLFQPRPPSPRTRLSRSTSEWPHPSFPSRIPRRVAFDSKTTKPNPHNCSAEAIVDSVSVAEHNSTQSESLLFNPNNTAESVISGCRNCPCSVTQSGHPSHVPNTFHQSHVHHTAVEPPQTSTTHPRHTCCPSRGLNNDCTSHAHPVTCSGLMNPCCPHHTPCAGCLTRSDETPLPSSNLNAHCRLHQPQACLDTCCQTLYCPCTNTNPLPSGADIHHSNPNLNSRCKPNAHLNTDTVLNVAHQGRSKCDSNFNQDVSLISGKDVSVSGRLVKDLETNKSRNSETRKVQGNAEGSYVESSASLSAEQSQLKFDMDNIRQSQTAMVATGNQKINKTTRCGCGHENVGHDCCRCSLSPSTVSEKAFELKTTDNVEVLEPVQEAEQHLRQSGPSFLLKSKSKINNTNVANIKPNQPENRELKSSQSSTKSSTTKPTSNQKINTRVQGSGQPKEVVKPKPKTNEKQGNTKPTQSESRNKRLTSNVSTNSSSTHQASKNHNNPPNKVLKKPPSYPVHHTAPPIENSTKESCSKPTEKHAKEIKSILNCAVATFVKKKDSHVEANRSMHTLVDGKPSLSAPTQNETTVQNNPNAAVTESCKEKPKHRQNRASKDLGGEQGNRTKQGIKTKTARPATARPVTAKSRPVTAKSRPVTANSRPVTVNPKENINMSCVSGESYVEYGCHGNARNSDPGDSQGKLPSSLRASSASSEAVSKHGLHVTFDDVISDGEDVETLVDQLNISSCQFSAGPLPEALADTPEVKVDQVGHQESCDASAGKLTCLTSEDQHMSVTDSCRLDPVISKLNPVVCKVPPFSKDTSFQDGHQNDGSDQTSTEAGSGTTNTQSDVRLVVTAGGGVGETREPTATPVYDDVISRNDGNTSDNRQS